MSVVHSIYDGSKPSFNGQTTITVGYSVILFAFVNANLLHFGKVNVE